MNRDVPNVSVPDVMLNGAPLCKITNGATHNLVLEKTVSSFNMLIDTAGTLTEDSEAGACYRMQEYGSYLHLFNMLKERDPEKLARAMEEHIEHTLSTLREIPAQRVWQISELLLNRVHARTRKLRSQRPRASAGLQK